MSGSARRARCGSFSVRLPSARLRHSRMHGQMAQVAPGAALHRIGRARRTVMFSIMCARSGLTRRSERLEGIGGSSLELRLLGPSMLGTGCADRHALSLTTSLTAPSLTRAVPARAGSFFAPEPPFIASDGRGSDGRNRTLLSAPLAASAPNPPFAMLASAGGFDAKQLGLGVPTGATPACSGCTSLHFPDPY